MKRMNGTYSFVRSCTIGLALLLGTLMTGCTEVNMAIDQLLGKQPAIVSAAVSGESQPSVIVARKTSPGEQPAAEKTPVEPSSRQGMAPAPVAPPPEPAQKHLEAAQRTAPTSSPTTGRDASVKEAKGKKALPGSPQTLPPPKKEEVPGAPSAPVATEPTTFTAVVRDPFKAPTEVLPSDCPPSMPLCKFDRSQLKLVGVIQVQEGNFKGMVEDPDGRGYFVTPGMQIGGATVTQVTQRGITLHLRKTGQDVVLPLFVETRE